MNTTIAYITFRGMLGRRRALLLFFLPAILILLALALRLTGNDTQDDGAAILWTFGLAVLLPLLSLIAGTGVIGPEIDDGQIMYVLTKPISRTSVIVTKYLCAVVLIVAFAVLPLWLAGAIMLGPDSDLPWAFAVGAFLGGLAYCSIFTALAVATRQAVTVGLIYALVWESLLGNFAPGTQTLSVQQWALTVVDRLTSSSTITASVGLPLSAVLLVLVTAAGLALATARLRTLTLASAD
ncbi:ABC transporter permease [Actinocorallia populi]|uniref:ABC transporter permease n=1 Tax=Actinocorallia populi TaxID=2079200 RepID=UPI000D08F5FA|nr:ABC transporter permease [Actinocorallia populi]